MDGITQFSLERRLQLPANAPLRLVEDIQAYSAFVELQAKMVGPASWYQNLA